ncbi:hypothetical protein [Streptomyces purpureus]|uniref:hypothetical protein n=1 Tax=Streptomyces purpureus TaxID=1951 RepID=UPI0003721868|nr:hypothetical protein [Streptomyces purpureus]
MTARILNDLKAPLLLLRALVADHAGLPAPGVSVSTVYPDVLELSFHDDFAGFEVWRDALAIAPDEVEHHVQGNGCTGVLRVHAEYGGARLLLVGYSKVPPAGQGRSQAGVAP